MPSFLTAPRTTSDGRGISRVNSFKRDWGDDKPDLSESHSQPEQHLPSSSQSRAVEWSPSPERVKRKPQMPPQCAPPAPATEELTPALRRRRAILEAMMQNSPPVPSVKPTVKPEPAPVNTYSSPSIPTPRPIAPVTDQKLPSLISRSNKRALPWEEDFVSGKRVMENGRASPQPGPSSSTSAPAPINIRQKIMLSKEQQKVLSLVCSERKNIFFTGSAGVGKSVLLREIISNLKKKNAKTPDVVAVTASTGIAACNIGGVTLHSFGGAGLATGSVADCVKKIRMNKKAASRWQRCKVLIIDEVSMVDGEMFDKFNRIGQAMRKRPGLPFGGIQLVVTGDFFQLPPVTKGGAQPTFCFEAETWNETIDMSINLTKVFRQKDQRFIDMLNEMRFGKLSPASIAQFRALARPLHYDDGIAATELFPHRTDVERSNNNRLNAIEADGWSYVAVDGGSITDPAQRQKILSNFMAPHTMWLKEGAQVMLIKNVDETLVNGSMGKVIGFCHRTNFVTDPTGNWRKHGAEEDIDESDLAEEKKAKLRELLASKANRGTKPLPVVRFSVPGGGSRDMLVEPDVWKNELPNGEVQVSRTQLPLILAWAMSIHKAQGQTLDRVKVDLGKVFEKGQAYVALSRATSLEGLQVNNFRAEKVQAHPKVVTWSQTLQNLNV